MSVDMSSKIDELAHNMGEVINRADALMDKFEKNEGDIAGIEESLENKADLLTRVESKTVGVGGDFTTIQECCDYYAKYITLKEVRVTVTLKRGYKWEKLRLVSCNLFFMDIKSEDEWIELADSKDYIIHLSNSIAPIMSNLKFRNTTGKRLAKLIYTTNNSFMLAPNISFDIRDDYEDGFSHCVYSGYNSFIDIASSSIKVRLTKAKTRIYNILVSSNSSYLRYPNPKIDFEDTFSSLTGLQLVLLLNNTQMSLDSFNLPDNSIKINIPKSNIILINAGNLTDIHCEAINLDIVAKQCIVFNAYEASRIQAVNIKNPKIRVTDTSNSYIFFAGGSGGYIVASLYVRGSSVDSKVIDTNITPNTIVEKGVIIK